VSEGNEKKRIGGRNAICFARAKLPVASDNRERESERESEMEKQVKRAIKQQQKSRTLARKR